MDITIHPGKLSGTISAIPSKSQAHRYLICAAFSDGPTELICPETNLDIEATVSCLNGLGADISRTETGYSVHPIGKEELASAEDAVLNGEADAIIKIAASEAVPEIEIFIKDFMHAPNTTAITDQMNNAWRAKQLGLIAIQRFFLLDSLALSNISKQIRQNNPDFIEVIPGAMPKIIREVTSSLVGTPLITGGLIRDTSDAINALEAGAIAVSVTNCKLIELNRAFVKKDL